MTYGCETWFLTPKVVAKLNGVNNKMLSRIMGSIIREEVRPTTSHFDLVKEVKVRVRRLEWAGDILRMDPERLLHKVIEVYGRFLFVGRKTCVFSDLFTYEDIKTTPRRYKQNVNSRNYGSKTLMI